MCIVFVGRSHRQKSKEAELANLAGLTVVTRSLKALERFQESLSGLLQYVQPNSYTDEFPSDIRRKSSGRISPFSRHSQ